MEANTTEYESLDQVITVSMLTAEKAISRHITTTYQWSPTLKKSVYCLRYWHLCLRQVCGQSVSVNQLLLFQREADMWMTALLVLLQSMYQTQVFLGRRIKGGKLNIWSGDSLL